MQNYLTNMMCEVDGKVSAIELNGENIIEDCKTVVVYLKKKLSELRTYMEAHPFRNEAEEIDFFKYRKPALLGRLLYFYEILCIETQRPFDEAMLDGYYLKRQEEQKLFFDRHVSFYQYYRSGASYLDHRYFLRGGQDGFDVDVCHLDDGSDFATGYDHLVARIMAMEMLYAFLTERRRLCLQRTDDCTMGLLNAKGGLKWTGSLVELVELVYGLQEMGCINDGCSDIKELTAYFGSLFGLEIKDSHCYNAYSDMKRRKSESRTYFLDKLRERLNLRMQRDDAREMQRR